ncbi:prenyltransferase/squalene oxidase repeat-containing protein [Glycomyces sp. NPDC047010]|uniref:prenyltransferase/squalene oxidase repeat-containing protein n=1 Tax=Glycomyces sp. NPDC047010 TaxID=3155023 RepID=UPI0033FDFF51
MPRRRWPTEAELNRSLTLAAMWLRRHRMPGMQAWPVSAGGSDPSLWGGTVDAVCAVTALRRSGWFDVGVLDDVDLGAAKRWAMTQQNRDGSFRSGEFAFSGAEPTAWTLIALHQITPDEPSREVRSALAYLESCIDLNDGSVSSAPHGDLPRTMPSALTLWAFALWRHQEDLRAKIVSYLLRCQDNSSHGWGVTSSARPNPATTAQVLVAFQAARVSEDDYRLAVEYLVDAQRDSGRWPNSLDEWAAARLTNKCANSGTAWSLLALAKRRDHRSRTACLRAVNYLIGSDQTVSGPAADRGSWKLYDDGAQRHVWLTGQIIVALAAWRNALPPEGFHRDGVRLTTWLLTAFDFLVSRAPLISTLGVLGAVVALTIGNTETGLRYQIFGDGVTFRQSLLTSGLGTAMLGALTWLYRGTKTWRTRRRQD